LISNFHSNQGKSSGKDSQKFEVVKERILQELQQGRIQQGITIL